MVRKVTEAKKKSSIIKKVALTTVIGMGLTFGSVYAEDSLPTIYHVYVDDEYIGAVEDKGIVQKYVQSQISDVQKDHKEYTLTTGEEISYVPEKVFDPSFNNQKVLDELKDEVSVEVETVGLSIGDETIAHLPTKEAAEEALQQLKLKYIDESTLKEVESNMKNSKKPEVKTGDSTIIDVTLSEEVSFSNEKTSLDDVLTVIDAVKLLQNGYLAEKKHKVAEGETLGEIAGQYDLDTDKLIELNKELKEDNPLQIGQELNVTEKQPYVDVIVKEETKKKETIDHETETKTSDSMYKGEEKVTQEGSDGEKVVHTATTKVNGKSTKTETLDEEVTKEAVNKLIVKGTKVKPSRGTGNFVRPTVGGTITSKQGQRWGSHHKGIDIAGVSDRTIKAADNGVVVSAGNSNDGYGNKIVINHNNGFKTIYAHLSSISVKPGQTVTRGSKIGMMGSTGHSTGVHLHFEVYKNGKLQNPLSHL
ncbi:peptidoglycan DD-metalloendopeptidase family protein [Thalassobacillus hwangdonensis]|uniref:Peptidoglycan DD-metalloendopeptidase family protein n=1 Tax=Thalassobacillus hwangdonensis TaxID=546108 RepID=A0ABW3L362_9BACI